MEKDGSILVKIQGISPLGILFGWRIQIMKAMVGKIRHLVLGRRLGLRFKRKKQKA